MSLGVESVGILIVRFQEEKEKEELKKAG